jgi:mRNA interferase RelE/StbE
VYRLEISHIAHEQIEVLPPRLAQRINEAIAGLANEPRPVGAKKLAGIEGYRVRVGDYRILYRINDESRLIVVYRVKHRREVYR